MISFKILMESKKLKVVKNMMADLIDSGLKYSIKKDGHEENLKILMWRMLGLVWVGGIN